VHYVSKLKALDTSEKDRALADLDKEKTNSREIQLRYTIMGGGDILGEDYYPHCLL